MCHPGQRAYLSVRLKSGGEITGYYVGASTDLEPAKREIIVGHPLAYRNTGMTEAEPLDSGWGALVISGSEIEYLVASRVGDAKVSTKPRFHQAIQFWISRHIFSWWPSTATVIVIFTLAIYFGNPLIRLIHRATLFP
jgi:hypothetical protein